MTVTVLLRITRSTGSSESHLLDLDGSRILVPIALMTSEDVVALDVDLDEKDADDRTA